MKIAVIGTGYVGLVTGACFADKGNQVTCLDIDQAKIEKLRAGQIPIYEPGLAEVVQRSQDAGRLQFTTDYGEAVGPAQLVFIAVGTPPRDDGKADLTALKKSLEQLASHLGENAIVVIKSTVPVGTNAMVNDQLAQLCGRPCDVASNPEFLKEGAAINDCRFPDRVVVGVRRKEVANVLADLYAPFLRTDHPFLVMAPESAEMTKYAANALLATKISFINEMAVISELAGADINDVRRGIGHDQRIGFAFLFPGVGYGGSCFPKDVRALEQTARELGAVPRILPAIDEVNNQQKRSLIEKIERHFQGTGAGKRFTIWGLSFKPRTDDIREAPALVLIDYLLEGGAKVTVYDPEAMSNVRQDYGDKLIYSSLPMEALEGADALAINTEWDEFRHLDFEEMRGRMASPVVFDGRNLYEPEKMRQLGFAYYSIGRKAVGV